MLKTSTSLNLEPAGNEDSKQVGLVWHSKMRSKYQEQNCSFRAWLEMYTWKNLRVPLASKPTSRHHRDRALMLLLDSGLTKVRFNLSSFIAMSIVSIHEPSSQYHINPWTITLLLSQAVRRDWLPGTALRPSNCRSWRNASMVLRCQISLVGPYLSTAQLLQMTSP